MSRTSFASVGGIHCVDGRPEDSGHHLDVEERQLLVLPGKAAASQEGHLCEALVREAVARMRLTLEPVVVPWAKLVEPSWRVTSAAAKRLVVRSFSSSRFWYCCGESSGCCRKSAPSVGTELVLRRLLEVQPLEAANLFRLHFSSL